MLRLWYLHDQPLLDDEVAAVRAVLRHGRSALLWTVVGQDFFRPVAFLARWWIEAGHALAEWHFRLPSLLAGLAAIPLLPLLARRTAGDATATLWAWLLAVSPLLVLYSRIARSYMPAALAATAALLLLADALERGSRRRSAAAAVCATLAVWFHPVAAPFVGGGFAFAAARALLDRSARGRGHRELLRTAIAAGLALAAPLLLPGLGALGRQVARKQARARIEPEVVVDALRYLAGTRSFLLAAALALLVVLGAARARRRWPALGSLLAAASALQLVCVWALSPYGADHELVLARYLMLALPALLLFVAAALAAPLARSPARWQPVAGAVIAAALLAAGPLLSMLDGRSSLAHHNSRLRFLELPAAVSDPIPTLLREHCAGDRRVVAWAVPSYGSRSFSELERIDRRLNCRFVLVDSDFVAAHAAVRFRNSVAPGDLARTGAGLLVMRLADFPPTRVRKPRSIGATPRPKPLRDRIESELRARFGEPDRRDRGHLLWKLPRAAPPAGR